MRDNCMRICFLRSSVTTKTNKPRPRFRSGKLKIFESDVSSRFRVVSFGNTGSYCGISCLHLVQKTSHCCPTYLQVSAKINNWWWAIIRKKKTWKFLALFLWLCTLPFQCPQQREPQFFCQFSSLLFFSLGWHFTCVGCAQGLWRGKLTLTALVSEDLLSQTSRHCCLFMDSPPARISGCRLYRYAGGGAR